MYPVLKIMLMLNFLDTSSMGVTFVIFYHMFIFHGIVMSDPKRMVLRILLMSSLISRLSVSEYYQSIVPED
jgi:hypothetical protein